MRVLTYLCKLVYDQDKKQVWAHWHLNENATRGAQPISYGELLKRTGIEFPAKHAPGRLTSRTSLPCPMRLPPA